MTTPNEGESRTGEGGSTPQIRVPRERLAELIRRGNPRHRLTQAEEAALADAILAADWRPPLGVEPWRVEARIREQRATSLGYCEHVVEVMPDGEEETCSELRERGTLFCAEHQAAQPPASVEHDAEADAWYVKILDADVHHTTENAPANLDWTRDGRLIGVELLGPLRRDQSTPLPDAPSPWDAYVAAFRAFQEQDAHGATAHPTAHHMHALEAALEVFEPCDRTLRSELLKAIDDHRGLGEAVALAIGDAYAGETFSDPTFERGTEAALRVFRELVEEVPSAPSSQPAPDGWYPAAMREHDRANAAELDRSAVEQRAASWWEAAKTLNRWGTAHRELHRKALIEIDRLKTVCKIAVGQRDRILGERDEARAKLDQVRGWLDMEEASTREWDGKHNPECECEVAQTTLEIIANIRAILAEVQL